jgi:hypothetical protein
MKTNKISTLRANGFSVINCTGNQVRIAAPVPFTYGTRQVFEKASQGDYRIVIGGQFSKELPRIIETK